MSTFNFLRLYIKIPHGKLLYVLYEITDFAFKDGTRDYVTAYNSGAFRSQFKNKTRRYYSLREIKFCLEFLINNDFIQVCPKIFRYSYEVRSCDILC